MAKFYGIIGYAITKVTTPGVWVDDVVERKYTGDVLKASRNWRSTENVNPDLTISETISIIADGFILENAQYMKYVKWRGAAWTIESITIERPRVILGIGGLYNGETAESTS
jgi:hypothetical protein